MVGLAMVLLFVVLAATIGLLSSRDPDTWIPGEQLQDPSWSHLLGTDNSGRDILVRLLYGARFSLLIGVACVAFSMLAGIPMGAVAGYCATGGRLGRLTDGLLSRLVDLLLAFPSILLAICIAAPLGASIRTVIIAVGVVGVPQFARQTRASVLAISQLDFVQASRALGAGHARILFLDILPSAVGPLIVLATLGIGTSILTAAGLSFLGLGVEAGTAEWGAMLHDGYQCWRQSPSLAVFSGLAISLAVLGFNLFGDGLRDALDPHTQRSW